MDWVLTLPVPMVCLYHFNKPPSSALHHYSSLYLECWNKWPDLTYRTPGIWAWGLRLQFQLWQVVQSLEAAGMTLSPRTCSLHFGQHRLLFTISGEVDNEHLDWRGPEVWLGEFSPMGTPQAFLFLSLVVWWLFWAIWGSSELTQAFAICLSEISGSLVWRLFWVFGFIWTNSGFWHLWQGSLDFVLVTCKEGM
jgi:hypothetical protein